MDRTHFLMGPWLCGFAVLAALISAPSCAPKASNRQTAIMAKTGKVSVSAAVLRARVSDLTDRFAGRIEQAADEASREATDDAVDIAALRLKVNAIPTVYMAGFRVDPLGAAMDLWGFAYQFRQFFDQGDGRSLFGTQQPVIKAAGNDLVADADQTMQSIATLPEHFEQARTTVQQWAAAHPVEHSFVSRPSGAAVIAELRPDTRSAFMAVGEISDVVESISERMNLYAAQMPRQARWQAEILVHDLTGLRSAEGLLDDVHGISMAAKRANDVLGDVPGTLGMNSLLDAGGTMLARERRAALADIDNQRRQTLQFVTAERVAMLDAVREERVALVAALHDERTAAFADINTLGQRSIDSSMTQLRELVDDTLWRVTAIIAGMMVLGAVIGVIAFRLTVGRTAT